MTYIYIYITPFNLFIHSQHITLCLSKPKMANKFIATTLVCILGALNLPPVITYATEDPFVRIRSTQFTLDGHPFLFNGFNSYWLMNMAAGPEQDRSKVADVLSEASANGLMVCRTWAFADGGNRALQLSPGVYDEHVFQVIAYDQKINTAYIDIYLHFWILICHSTCLFQCSKERTKQKQTVFAILTNQLQMVIYMSCVDFNLLVFGR